MKPFPIVFFDIVGICNAKCPYCTTGANKKSPGGIISTKLFSDTLKQLLKKGAIDSQSTIYLYNWGEPFLHPDINGIVNVINDLKLTYAISTNAARVPEINKAFVENLREVLFSMPGFSQESYDRIHGFKFEKIKLKIVTLVGNLRSHGFKGDFIIAYHVYRFNLNEMKKCEVFANSIGAEFSLGTQSLMTGGSFKHGWMDHYPMKKRYEFQRNFLPTGIKETMDNAPKDYICPQLDLLVIDENTHVLTCCAMPKNHPDCLSIDINSEDIEAALKHRADCPVCIRCKNSGLAYYLNTALFFPEFYRLGSKQILILMKKNKFKKAMYHLAPRFLKQLWWKLKKQRL